MNKTCLLLLILALGMNSAVFAGSLPGGLKGSLEITYEDDLLDADRSLSRSKLTIKKPLVMGGMDVIPYAYFENEMYEGIMAGERKETEAAAGFDVVPLKNELTQLTLGAAYEYENNAAGDDDALFILKVNLDF